MAVIVSEAKFDTEAGPAAVFGVIGDWFTLAGAFSRPGSVAGEVVDDVHVEDPQFGVQLLMAPRRPERMTGWRARYERSGIEHGARVRRAGYRVADAALPGGLEDEQFGGALVAACRRHR